MAYLQLALTSASLLLSLYAIYKLRETLSTLAIIRASHLSLKERLKGQSLDFEGFSAADLLALQELIDNSSALTSITEETTTLLEEYQKNLERLLFFGREDVIALQELIDISSSLNMIAAYFPCMDETQSEALENLLSNNLETLAELVDIAPYIQDLHKLDLSNLENVLDIGTDEISFLQHFNESDALALQALIECGDLGQYIDSYVCHYADETQVVDLIDQALSNLVIAMRGDL